MKSLKLGSTLECRIEPFCSFNENIVDTLENNVFYLNGGLNRRTNISIGITGIRYSSAIFYLDLYG